MQSTAADLGRLPGESLGEMVVLRLHMRSLRALQGQNRSRSLESTMPGNFEPSYVQEASCFDSNPLCFQGLDGAVST